LRTERPSLPSLRLRGTKQEAICPSPSSLRERYSLSRFFGNRSNLFNVTVIANGTPLFTVIASEVQRNEAICLIEGQIASAPTLNPMLGLRNDGNNEQ